jgi:hypothetical protein
MPVTRALDCLAFRTPSTYCRNRDQSIYILSQAWMDEAASPDLTVERAMEMLNRGYWPGTDEQVVAFAREHWPLLVMESLALGTAIEKTRTRRADREAYLARLMEERQQRKAAE